MTDEKPKPLPVIPLAELVGVRPPWSWSNLTVDEAEVLDVMLTDWVADYNTQHTTDTGHVIPACWRQHPALAHQIPVLFWTWWDTHRNPDAQIQLAGEWYGRHLPAFQERLDGLLGQHGQHGSAANCRAGKHDDRPKSDASRLADVARANTADAAARGPVVLDVLVHTTFGTAPSAAP